MATDEPPFEPLRGMLHKKHRHQHLMLNWGRRYFEVNDERGILFYFRTRAAHDWDEPARHFLLSALRSVRSGESGSHTLEVTYEAVEGDGSGDVGKGKTASLLLRADSESEKQRWIDGLQSRIRRLAEVIHATKRREAGWDDDAPPSIAASAIASATLAARRAEARASSAAAAADICLAMGVTERPPSTPTAHASGCASGRRGGRAAPVDIATFLEQRQREVWAELEASGSVNAQAAVKSLHLRRPSSAPGGAARERTSGRAKARAPAPPASRRPTTAGYRGRTQLSAHGSAGQTMDAIQPFDGVSDPFECENAHGGSGPGRVACGDDQGGGSVAAAGTRSGGGASTVAGRHSASPGVTLASVASLSELETFGLAPDAAAPAAERVDAAEKGAAVSARADARSGLADRAGVEAAGLKGLPNLAAAAEPEALRAVPRPSTPCRDGPVREGWVGSGSASDAEDGRGRKSVQPATAHDAVSPAAAGAGSGAAEELQLQMMIAMGATPFAAQGAAGGACWRSNLSRHAPSAGELEMACEMASAAWGADPVDVS